MATTLYQAVTGLLFLLLIWAAVMFYKNPSWALAMLLPLLAWLIFDPLVMALGNKLGEGSMLYVLTWLRYVLRVLAMPFLLIVAFDQVRRARLDWANDPLANLGVWVVVLILVVLGFVRAFWGGFGMEITELDGIKQYKEVEAIGLPISAIITLAMITLFGALTFMKTRSPWLLLGALVWLMAIVLPTTMIPSFSAAIASALFVMSVLLCERAVQKISPNPRQ